MSNLHEKCCDRDKTETTFHFDNRGEVTHRVVHVPVNGTFLVENGKVVEILEVDIRDISREGRTYICYSGPDDAP